MKTKLINPENKLTNDDIIALWLERNASDIDSVEYRSAIIGADGKTAYRTISASGLDGLFKLTNELGKFGLFDIIRDKGPVNGFDSIFAVEEIAQRHQK